MLGALSRKVKSARGEGVYDVSRFQKNVHDKRGVYIVPLPRDATYKGTLEAGIVQQGRC
jgi:hypothetical protein